MSQILIGNETTPLLAPPVTANDTEAAHDAAAIEEPKGTSGEIWLLIKFAIPTWATLLLEASLFATTVICVGRLGTDELASSTMGAMTSSVLGFTFIQGMATALDTLCAQSWTSNPSTTSLHALRTACLLTIALIPQFIIFWNAEWLLLKLGQEPEVARLAGLYLKVVSFGLPGSGYFECLRRWLQAQGLMHVPTILLCFVAPLNMLLSYTLVWSKPFGMGYIGAPIATCISMNLMFIGGVIYAYFFVSRKGWGGFTKEVFTNWGECFKLGVAGIAMVGSEVWALEIMGFGASYLGAASLAANSVLGIIQFLFYLPALAISIAASVRLGNLLGANRPKQARKVAKIGLAMGFAVGAINMVVLLLTEKWIGKIFTQEPDVLAIVRYVLPVVAFYQLADSTAGAGYGIMRGSGQSPIAAMITGFSYWVLGLPTAFFCMFALKKGLIGLWFGTVLGLFVVAVGTSVYISGYLNFEREAEKAQERAEADRAEAAAAAAAATPSDS
ncbi:hypothetical protein MNV49_001585 [Pseudohyphozyma bogoriensis]|nr:hypothetical protein MNV49_001585 [Pseudohyphozyma bogoriensis]